MPLFRRSGKLDDSDGHASRVMQSGVAVVAALTGYPANPRSLENDGSSETEIRARADLGCRDDRRRVPAYGRNKLPRPTRTRNSRIQHPRRPLKKAFSSTEVEPDLFLEPKKTTRLVESQRVGSGKSDKDDRRFARRWPSRRQTKPRRLGRDDRAANARWCFQGARCENPRFAVRKRAGAQGELSSSTS